MPTAIPQTHSRRLFIVIGCALVLAAGAGVALAAAQARRDFDVVAYRYAYRVSGSDGPEIHVMQNDLVHINFSTEDIPHSFTIEEPPYRIMRRAAAGKPVSFDFRADHPGRFRFYCNLTADEKCREQHGTLIVEKGR